MGARLTRPLLLAVDADREALARTEHELQRRWGSDFRVRTERTGAAALTLLEDAAENGDAVALVLVDQWLPPMVAPERQNDATLIAPLRTMCREVGVEVFAAQVDALLSRPTVEPVLAHIKCPTLVAVGSEDCWSPPAQHQAIAEALDARLHVIDHAGHMLPAEAPDLLNATIADWLTWPTHAQGVS